MGRKANIDMLLPPEIKDELIKRIAANKYTIDELFEWVTEKGHKISRSAIGRFSISLGVHGNSSDKHKHFELRMRCVEAASLYSTADTIIANATNLFRWINPPR